jgi:hypothetical protein
MAQPAVHIGSWNRDRRAADWIAGLVIRGIVDQVSAEAMVKDCTYGRKWIKSMVVLHDWTLNVDADMVLRAQGADPGMLRARRSRAVAIAEQAIASGLPLLAPAVSYRRLPVKTVRHERLILDNLGNGAFLSGPLIVQHLHAAQEVIALVCTIGSALESYASECFKDDPALGMTLDSLGSIAVDLLGTAACLYFESWAEAENLKTTLPLSPGLAGWPVAAGQRELFSLVDADEIGVKLNEDCMMIPRKSTSLVIGLGANVTQAGRICDYCNLRETCHYQEYYA